MKTTQILLMASILFGAGPIISYAEIHLSGSNDILSNNDNMIILPDGEHVASMLVSDQKKAEIARDKEYNDANSNVSNYYPSPQSQSNNNSTPQTESNQSNNDNSNDSPTDSSDTSLDGSNQNQHDNNGEQHPPYYPPYNPPQPTPVSQNHVETNITVKNYKKSAFSYNQNKYIQFDFLNDFTVSQKYPSTIIPSTLKICTNESYSNCSNLVNIGSNNTFTLNATFLNKNKTFIAYTSSQIQTNFYIPVFYFIATDNKNNMEYRFSVEIPSYRKSQVTCSSSDNTGTINCILPTIDSDKQNIAPYIP